jgi:type II secretory ATPase GspE/PulE/Tfp pilus assembly ATPase PilB-like protein
MNNAGLGEIIIERNVLDKVPANVALRYKIIPINFESNLLTIASSRPEDVSVRDGVSLIVAEQLKFVLATENEILEKIRFCYGLGAETIESMMKTVDVSVSQRQSTENLDDIASDASVTKFVNQILLEAYRDRATDIHFEPYENELVIRYRIDGILYDAKVPSEIKHFKDAINSRIKIMANLNITEKRLPQDGRFSVTVNNINLDLRVSFLPTPYGESVEVRLLNSNKLYSMEELGLSTQNLQTLDHLIYKPHGIIFLTGPTGSGKTTTLYSCLSKVNTMDKKIVTIEDPIEYRLRGVTQIQTNSAIGLTFAAGLRSVLRHDPDIMMIGEVRDLETAEIAIQVSLTGHLVFSTLHTNDAISGVTRLIDMGIEPYLITDSVECFIAQRLIRLICPHCKEKAKQRIRDTMVYEGKGCPHCKSTGYFGREAIYEFFVLNDEIREMIVSKATAAQLKDKAISNGMSTLFQEGWRKAEQGLTTANEILRVTQEDSL